MRNLNPIQRVFGVLLVLLMMIVVATPGLAVEGKRNAFLFMDQLTPGMVGIGKTVIQGNLIEEFEVEIIDILDNPKTLNDFIVVRVRGDVIDRAGGIAQGMSGSPVYIDGKLIGALSRAANWDDSDDPIGLVTPIEVMLELLGPVADKVEMDREPEKQEPGQESTGLDSGDLHGNDVIKNRFRQISTPVSVAGLGERALQLLIEGLDGVQKMDPQLLEARSGIRLPGFSPSFSTDLEQGLGRYDLSFYRIGSASASATGFDSDATEIVPGSPLGVQLTHGDVSITAIGTVTYRESDKILAFGHSFLFNGDSDFFLTTARISDTVNSLQAPFKLGIAGEPLGAILEDRFQGIAGALSVEPESVQVQITISDDDLSTSQQFEVQTIKEQRLAALLVLSVALETIDSTLNRIGPGVLEVRYRISGDGLPRDVERRDVFLSVRDIAVTAPIQIAQVVNILEFNEFNDPELREINVDIEVSSELKAMEIRSLEFDRETYAPGDLVNYQVALKPYRDEVVVKEGTLKIPEDTDVTRLTVQAFGGKQFQNDEEEEELETFESLEELIKAIEEINSNDQLTVKFIGLSKDDKDKDEDEDDENRDEGDEDPDSLQPGTIQKLKIDGYVLFGEETQVITIQQPEPVEKPEADQVQETKPGTTLVE
ncbi:MAG: SpoIVB peptidase S55 domain-containing protein [Candidatus Bipolaricaulia bacterium]